MKIKAIIEKANDGGVSVYSEDVDGAYGYGLTESEAKQDFVDILSEQAEFYQEKYGELPQWYAEGFSVDYVYDLSGFFVSFPFINASKFAKAIGINASMMRKYKGKIVTASEKQRSLIQHRYNELLSKMQTVRF